MTAREEATLQLRRLSFSGIAAHFCLEVAVDDPPVSRGRPVRCVARMTLPDTSVLEGEVPPFRTETAFHLHWGDDVATVASLVEALHDRLLHEFAESVWVDGGRPLDPHASTRAWSRFRSSCGSS